MDQSSSIQQVPQQFSVSLESSLEINNSNSSKNFGTKRGSEKVMVWFNKVQLLKKKGVILQKKCWDWFVTWAIKELEANNWDQEQSFSWYLDNNLTWSEFICLILFLKVPYHQRKTYIDFGGYDMYCFWNEGQKKGLKKAFPFYIWTVTWVNMIASVYNFTTMCHSTKRKFRMNLGVVTWIVKE